MQDAQTWRAGGAGAGALGLGLERRCPARPHPDSAADTHRLSRGATLAREPGA